MEVVLQGGLQHGDFHAVGLLGPPCARWLVLVGDLRLPKKNSANGQKCFSFRGVKLWNSLPAESKTASSLNGFKKSIKG